MPNVIPTGLILIDYFGLGDKYLIFVSSLSIISFVSESMIDIHYS